MVTWLLNTRAAQWAMTLGVLALSVLGLLWRAYVRGEQAQKSKQKEAAYDAERQRADIEADIDRGPDPRDELRRDWMRHAGRD